MAGITINLTPEYKQHLVYQALKNPEVDTIFFGGGAGGGKTWTICETRLVKALQFPGYRSFIAREELKRLMQSTFVTWTKVCAFHKIPSSMWKLNGQYNYIEFTNGSRIDLLDVKLLPTDPMFERLGSLEYTDGAIEEAGEIHFMAYDVLKSRIGRHMNKEFNIHPTILISGNPKKNWTYTEFYKPWKNGTLSPRVVFVQALFNDNHYTAEEYGKQLAQIKDKATRERLMNGNWEYDVDDNAIMGYDAITDLFSNTVPEDKNRYLIADIARLGQDKTVFHIWEGKKLIKRFEYSKQGIDETSEQLKKQLMQYVVPRSHCLVDEDGVGGGVIDNVKGVKGFHGGATPFDDPATHKPDFYQNLKAQCAYKLAAMVNERELFVDIPDILIQEKIKSELEQIKSKDKDKDGKRKIVPKEEVKEILGRSPDDSDCLLMRMWFELGRKQSDVAYTYISSSALPTHNSSPQLKTANVRYQRL